MKKIAAIAAILFGCTIGIEAANAETITFDDLNAGTTISSYDGFKWYNVTVVDSAISHQDGYLNGIVSGNNAILNTGDTVIKSIDDNMSGFYSSRPFTLVSAMVTGTQIWWLETNDTSNNTNHVTGGGTAGIFPTPHIFDFQLQNINGFFFQGSGGALEVDDIVINFSTTAVPELSTWAMMLIGFVGLGFLTYRRTGPKDSPASAAA